MPTPALPPPPLDNGVLAPSGKHAGPWGQWFRQLWDTLREPEPSWTAATMLNSWVTYSSQFNEAAYMKDSLGFVMLRGLVKNGSAPGVVFTLPAGYRPAKDVIFAGISSAGAAGLITDVRVLATGDVRTEMAHNAWLSLEGIRFRVE